MSSSAAQTRHGTFVFILPWLEQQNLHGIYQFKYKWNDTRNRPAVRNHLPVLICPSAPVAKDRTIFANDPDDYYTSDYGVLSVIAPDFRDALVPFVFCR